MKYDLDCPECHGTGEAESDGRGLSFCACSCGTDALTDAIGAFLESPYGGPNVDPIDALKAIAQKQYNLYIETQNVITRIKAQRCQKTP